MDNYGYRHKTTLCFATMGIRNYTQLLDSPVTFTDMKKKRGTQKPDDTELSLFKEAMKDVRPLSSSDKVLHETRPPRVKFHQEYDDIEPGFADPSIDGDIGVEDSLFYNSGGLQQSLIKKLKRGLIPIEARLDLHGMNREQANLTLGIFLDDAQQQGFRCINVIHGKGYRSSENIGILKSLVNHWLQQHPGIIAFASAPPKDGGTGALNILLRRK